MDYTDYNLTILAICSICPAFFAAHLYVRWAVVTQLPFWLFYVLFLGVLAVIGIVMLGGEAVIGKLSPETLSLSLVGGAGLGLLAYVLDQNIIRSAARALTLDQIGEEHKTSMHPGQSVSEPYVVSVKQTIVTRPSSAQKEKRAALMRQSAERKVVAINVNPACAIFTGVLEELIYRGVLLALCLAIPSNFLSGIAIILSVFAFALSHLQYGWYHTLAKLPLGLLALSGTLILGSVLCGIVVHTCFNLMIYRKLHDGG